MQGSGERRESHPRRAMPQNSTYERRYVPSVPHLRLCYDIKPSHPDGNGRLSACASVLNTHSSKSMTSGSLKMR